MNRKVRGHSLACWISVFCFSFLTAQTERDSITRLLANDALTSQQQWEILEPFLADQAKTWSGEYVDLGKQFFQLAKDHFPNRSAYAATILGELYFGNDDFQNAMEAYRYGLEHIDETDAYKVEKRLNLGIGNIFHRRVQNDKARNYYKTALSLAEAEKDSSYIALALMSVANTYIEDSLSFDSSAFYLYKAKDLAEAINDPEYLLSIYNNIVYLEDENGNFEIARDYTFRLLDYAMQSNDKEALLLGWGNLGYSYGKYDQQYDSAIFYLKKGLEQYDPRYAETAYLLEFYKEIANNYENAGNADSALVYLKKFIHINDSLQTKHFNQGVQEIEAKYQTEQREKLLTQAQLETERQTNLRQLTIGVSLLVIGLLFGIFQYFRSRQKLARQKAEYSLELNRAEAKQLRELDQLKSNFFANISHEFRTPLTLILGPLEQFKNGTLKEGLQQYATVMHRNATRLKDLINQLLDLSKLESGKVQLQESSGDLFLFSKQLAHSFHSWASQKEMDYQINIPNESLYVHFDRDKYEKILTNLLSNALKYTPHNGQVSLTLDYQSSTDKIILKAVIKDTGVGIPKGHQDKIFYRFYQSAKNEDGVASSGIGLAITKELIELHGGNIEVDSKEGKGTTFTFHLPLKLASIVDHSVSMPTQQKAMRQTPSQTTPKTFVQKTSSSKQNPILLVVEDNADVRNYIVDQIQEDYQILEAPNGKEGLHLAFEKVPDLIITDLMMPQMTGNELTAQLKNDERTSHIPIIILTAKANQSDKIEGLETGADDYLTKPFNAQELQVRIKNLIAQREQLKVRFSQKAFNLAPKSVTVNSVDEQFLNRLMEILEKEIDNEQLSVEELSRMIGMSRSQLHRKLKAIIGKTPTAFLRSFRMQRAHQLLSQNAGNASEVAFMVGFSSLAYFSKCFKDEFGKTPTEVMG